MVAHAPEVRPEAGAALRRSLAGFVRTLRDNGFTVGLAETRDALAVLASPASTRAATLKPALKALLCATRSDWQKFDAIFDVHFLKVGMRGARRAVGVAKGGRTPSRRLAEIGAPGGPLGAPDHAERGGDNPADGRGRREGASLSDSLATTDMRHITDPEDLAAAHAFAARLARSMRARLTRREKARRAGARLDLRRTIHRNIGHGGTPIELVRLARKRKPLRLVILLDASGSMELYTALFVRFVHGVLDAFREAEAFVFHTRLAHVSQALRERDAARAVERLSLMAQGIGGGTRIGECLATFNAWHAARVIHSRTAVMIVSDGYDTGPPERLATEMRQLRRRCRRIVWLNPMLGWPGYRPETRGIQAALPYVDLFAPAHDLASLMALEPYLTRI